RMNAQSNPLENYFARAGIPYRVYGGQKFYDRMEIKDVLAYLQLVDNENDNLRLTRIINKPARKIGDATIAEISRISEGLGVPMLEVIKHADEYDNLSRARNALKEFVGIYERLLESREENSLGDFVESVISITGYRAMLTAQGDEGQTRLENVEELVSNIRIFEKENPEGTLSDFLEDIALVTGIDNYDEDAETVTLMTLHSAKGLEFDCVYIVGLEEGIFPGEASRYNNEDIEEERRLAYVGITRAKKRLCLTRSQMRMLFGTTRRNPESRFLKEIDDELKEDLSPKRAQNWRAADGGFSEGFSGYGEARRDYGGRTAAKPAERGSVTLASSITLGSDKPKTDTAKGTSFQKGERVEHKIFGTGTVLSATPLGGDTLVEIEFDKAGVKKAMANYAPMKKL
ncbi:MAG: ATP-binding domain-containing protein, partial [Ruminococcaceae bacterium]|nr:ATP-binding domain-containing protein [Oscillospiraceae bacterium]